VSSTSHIDQSKGKGTLMTEQPQGQHNVIAVNFQDDSQAYQALSQLKELDGQSQIGLRAAAVVVRGEDGKIVVKEQVGEGEIEGAATGGILGLLIGIIGGPFGILIGGATGLVIGALFDVEEEDQTESVLGEFSKQARVGHPALLAEAFEPGDEPIDAAMSRLSGNVLRRPVDVVEAEMASAREAQRVAKHEARKALHEQQRAQKKAEVETKVEDLKAKLHPQKEAEDKVAATASG
jgi:uncharacterized membrane protein